MGMHKSVFKQAVSILLVVMMLFGGAASAFADGKGHSKGNDDDDDGDHKNNHGKDKVKIEVKFDFNDLEKSEWARKYIARLAADQIFDGYEDGTFRPTQSVKRIEAIIAAVRLMGLRADAESAARLATDLNFEDADQIAKKYPNAVGYVAVAVENDLFLETEEKVNPEKAADRLWATMLLVKAMKWEDLAKTKMNVKLPFMDADKIPAGAVGYVAVAIEKGLIKGYEDLTFRPNKPVTRAELAVLLGQMDDQQPDSADSSLIRGTVTSAVYGNVLTLSQNSVITTHAINPNAFIYRMGVKVTAADIKIGDVVIAKQYNNEVIFIDVKTAVADPTVPPVAFTFEGQYQYVTWNTDNKIATIVITQTVDSVTTVKSFNVASNVTITPNASLLVLNSNVVLKGNDLVVSSIEIK
ncbi:MAG: S-layer homology domain-containing protein [Paenibacillaceae bacterium]